jgi:salicylate hydroxylase
MPPAPRYSCNRTTLLGDAAHASTSHAGAGAGMAVEDAFILSELLSSPKIQSSMDISAVFAAYSNIRLPRTQRLVQHSRESGLLFQMRQPGVGDDIEKLEVALKDRQCWIWDMDLDEHLEDAKMELRRVFDDALC